MWDQKRIEQHIADGVEESLTLDYKAAKALHAQNKAEIQKDVSAFANSAGGVIIYGVREHNPQGMKHLPERIDPISRSVISKEWLEQVISGIQPRVPGVVIHPVQLNTHLEHCCYVVEIPQSETIHQAKDYRYYRRYNFENRAMEDFEVREAMNRVRHPQLEVSFRFTINKPGQQSYFIIKLKNIGRRIASDYLCKVAIPIELNGAGIEPESPYTFDVNGSGQYSNQFALCRQPAMPPLFPGLSINLEKRITLTGRISNPSSGVYPSDPQVRITVYADEMEPVNRSSSISQCINCWA